MCSFTFVTVQRRPQYYHAVTLFTQDGGQMDIILSDDSIV